MDIEIVSICHANSRETVQETILMQKVVKYCPWALFIGQSELSCRSEISKENSSLGCCDWFYQAFPLNKKYFETLFL